MSETESVTVTVMVEPETLVSLAARVGEEYHDRGALTTDDIDQLVSDHFELEPVFEVKGVEQPVDEWLTEHTHIELEGDGINNE
ncbi:hypothetical protein [Natrinema hispanicum]|uniref:Uncharacterized protein n=1 Tax=Natrinema hispanicum TaxID=392421 RepID=A0A1I0ITZ4_9EURY|nr:hypothetical protein [Natrinema hispanicum]SEU00697.1 hypothetical protein SAMN04488694_1261 [Natrinema hispanicum]